GLPVLHAGAHGRVGDRRRHRVRLAARARRGAGGNLTAGERADRAADRERPRAPPGRRPRASVDMGAPTWPPNPQRSRRPGGAVTALVSPLVGDDPAMAPKPQRSRRPGGAVTALVIPLVGDDPDMAPKPPALAPPRR